MLTFGLPSGSGGVEASVLSFMLESTYNADQEPPPATQVASVVNDGMEHARVSAVVML